mgnify:CR=1 FL=1
MLVVNNKKKLLTDGALIAIPILWGGGFIAVKLSLDAGLSPGLVNLLRFSIASVFMLPFCLPGLRLAGRREWLYGFLAGFLLIAGFIFQTVGQKYTTPSNNAFLTTLNVIIVPFAAWAFTKKRPQKRHIVSAFVSLAGIFLLTYSLSQGLRFRVGDMLSVMCSVFFACHIAFLGKISGLCDIRTLTFIQMLTGAVFSLGHFLLLDRASAVPADMGRGLWPVLYLGATACVCFFLQTFAQKHTHAAKAAVFFSTEALFGSLFSVLLSLEPMTVNLVAGGAVMFIAVLLTELPGKRASEKRVRASTGCEALPQKSES